MSMKKFFLFAALVAAVAMNAKEIEIDLSKAAEMSYDGCKSSFYAEDGVLVVDYETPSAWLWTGVEFELDNLTNVTNIKFDYMGKGEGVVLFPYLRDEEGNRWTKDDFYPSLEEKEWTPIEVLPDAPLWDSPAYKFGEKAFTKLGFITNPGTARKSTFYLRNVKITVAGEETAIDNTAAEAKTVKVIRDGQVLILRDGRTFNALGAEVK